MDQIHDLQICGRSCEVTLRLFSKSSSNIQQRIPFFGRNCEEKKKMIINGFEFTISRFADEIEKSLCDCFQKVLPISVSVFLYLDATIRKKTDHQWTEITISRLADEMCEITLRLFSKSSLVNLFAFLNNLMCFAII